MECLTFRRLFEKLLPSNQWFPRLLGNAVILDTETTGFDPQRHRVVQLGLCPVEKGIVSLDQIVDLTIQTPYDPETWGAVYGDTFPNLDRFAELADAHGVLTAELLDAIDANGGSLVGIEGLPESLVQATDDSGKPLFRTAVDIHRISPKQSMTTGMPRKDALWEIYSTLELAIRDDLPLIGHNLFFDVPFLMHEFKRELDLEFVIPPDLLFDTGLAVKAAQLGEIPKDDETLFDFLLNVRNIHAIVKWSLDRFCVPTFQLHQRYGIQTDRQHQSAAYDAYVVGCLLQELHRLAQSC